MKKTRESMDQWKNTTLKKVLDRSPEREEVFRTESGIPVKRLYTPVDVEAIDALGVDLMTLRFGPLGADVLSPPRFIYDTDYDGNADAGIGVDFLMGQTGIACTDTEVLIRGDSPEGMRVGTALINPDCDAFCH